MNNIKHKGMKNTKKNQKKLCDLRVFVFIIYP